MLRIGLLAKPSVTRYKVKSEIQKDKKLRVAVFSDVNDLARALKNNELKSIVILVSKFSDEHLLYMDQITNKFPHLPFIFVTSYITDETRKEIIKLSFHSSTVIHYHHELKSLNYLLTTSMQGQKLNLRNHCRFQVNQYAYLQNESGQKVKINLLDLSKGGLKAQLHHAPPKKDTVLTVLIPQGDSYQSHEIVGHVAWTDVCTLTLGICFKIKKKIQAPHLKLLTA